MTRAGVVWGTLFVLVGLYALLVELGVWAARPGWTWPAVLMALGAALLAGGMAPRDRAGGPRGDEG